MRTPDLKPRLDHENFKLGQGYGSAEKGSEASLHVSTHQYGDNPLPKSGGGYAKAGDIQPDEEADEIFSQSEHQTSADQKLRENKIKAQRDKR
jgi:hypothetical protein